MWSDEEIKRAVGELPPEDATEAEQREAARAIMTIAAELLAAHSGTMTADQTAALLAQPWCVNGVSRDDVGPHLCALGARVAVLEMDRYRWKGCAEGNENAWKLADARADSAAEVMRAACLEAALDALGALGFTGNQHVAQVVKCAIEGAAP